METINIIENKVEVIKQDYTLYNKEVLHACFVTGATYQVPCSNLISKGVEVQFTVVKNTHKSVTIEVVEKYNGTINTSKAVKRLNSGGVGFWKTIQGVEYATVETFNANKLTRWVKGYINPFGCELATKELTVELAEKVEPVEKAEPVQEVLKVDYVSKIKDITNKFDNCIDNLDEKRLLTIYVMLTKFGGNAWAKEDKARIYINNGFEFVETEKLELIKSNVWIGNIKFDWYKWNVNGFQTYDVFKHAKDDKSYCSQLSQSRIDIDLYYDVIANKFVYTDDTFKVAETVIEKIKAVVQEMKSLEKAEPVAEVEKAEPVAEVEKVEPVAVEEIPKTDLLDYVMKNFDLTERQSHDINRFYPDFIDKKEFGYIIDFLNDIYGFVSYAIKLIKTHGSYDTLDMYCRSDIVEIIFNYSTATKELYEDGTNAIFILMRDCLGSNNSRYISKCNNRLYIENDVLIDKEFSKISYDKRNDILDLIEHCEHFTTKKELLSIVSTQFNISKDIVIELYNKYMDNLYLDENIEPVEETPTVEPVEEVGLDINTSYPELQCFEDIEKVEDGLDINTSYPELQCFEDIEKVEENTVFKVGCFYTGSDKSLYLVTKRGLNTIDLMSISKGFKEYDIPIVTDIYDNEYTTISYSNSISVISSIDIKYTEKNFKRTLYDFVNNNFYGNDVYGKYDVEDVKRVLNMLYGKIID